MLTETTNKQWEWSWCETRIIFVCFFFHFFRGVDEKLATHINSEQSWEWLCRFIDACLIPIANAILFLINKHKSWKCVLIMMISGSHSVNELQNVSYTLQIFALHIIFFGIAKFRSNNSFVRSLVFVSFFLQSYLEANFHWDDQKKMRQRHKEHILHMATIHLFPNIDYTNTTIYYLLLMC